MYICMYIYIETHAVQGAEPQSSRHTRATPFAEERRKETAVVQTRNARAVGFGVRGSGSLPEAFLVSMSYCRMSVSLEHHEYWC